MSERRDSNPRPRPWQGRALPTELLSLISLLFGNAKITLDLHLSIPLQCFFQGKEK